MSINIKKLGYKKFKENPKATIIIPNKEDIPMEDRSRFFKAAIKHEKRQLFFND